MSSWSKSKLDVKFSVNVDCADDSAPEGDTANALLLFDGSTLIPNPGLLSISCSPGYINIVVLSIKSLFFPRTYENLADSIKPFELF